MLFGALFASYILIRTGAPTWPRGDTILNVPLATFNTLVLISSSRHHGDGLGVAEAPPLRDLPHVHGRDDPARVRLPDRQVLRVQPQVRRSGCFPSTNNFLAIYFTLTGLHVLHVFGGMV